jgi:integrase
MALLLDHGLRVGELAALVVEELEITKGLLRFYRPKVGKEQIHRLSPDTMRALQAYAACGDLPAAGPLLRRSLKDGSLGEAGVSERGLTQRVCVLGEELGIAGLSAHDCRHFWATSAARHGTDPFSLQEAGGWSSLAMPRRYVEDNQVANEKVKLE